MIELAVHHTCTGGHALYFASPNHRAVTHAVLVLDSPVNNVGHDFHVPVRMRSEAMARSNTVLVDHPETVELHSLGIVVVGERERVFCF